VGDKRLLDFVAIVTGASRGIGRATALALAQEGAHVALAARSASALEEVAEAIRSLGRDALCVPTDVRQQAQVEHLVSETLIRWGRVDILVTSAGIYPHRRIVDLTASDLEESLDTNFYGTVYAVLTVLPHMLAQRQGHIVLMSSVQGRKALPTDAAYAVSKFAVAAFGDVLRQELHGTGVYATTVFPGRVDTDFIANLVLPWFSGIISAEAVAKAIVRAIDRRQAEVILPFGARALIYGSILWPRLGDWAVRLLRLEGHERQQTDGATKSPRANVSLCRDKGK